MGYGRRAARLPTGTDHPTVTAAQAPWPSTGRRPAYLLRFWPTKRIIAYPGTQLTRISQLGFGNFFSNRLKFVPLLAVLTQEGGSHGSRTVLGSVEKERPGTGVGQQPGRGGPSVLGRRIAWVCFSRSVFCHRRDCQKGVLNLRPTKLRTEYCPLFTPATATEITLRNL